MLKKGHKEQIEHLKAVLPDLMLGDDGAVRFLLSIYEIAQIWDDCVDQDRKLEGTEVDDVFLGLFFFLRKNPFYMAFENDLNPLIMNAYLEWHDSRELEKTGNLDDLHKAFMLRAGMLSLIPYCAFLVGGVQHARRIGPQARRLYT